MCCALCVCCVLFVCVVSVGCLCVLSMCVVCVVCVAGVICVVDSVCVWVPKIGLCILVLYSENCVLWDPVRRRYLIIFWGSLVDNISIIYILFPIR